MKFFGPVFLLLAPCFAPAQSYKLVQFDYPSATTTIGLRINNSGQILGIYTDSSKVVHCFLRGPDGVYTTLGEPPGALPATTSCRGLNNLGQVVGGFRDARGFHGYIRSTSGNFTTFDFPGTIGPGAFAEDINDRGEIVGPIDGPPEGDVGFFRAADGTFSILQSFATGSIAPLAVNNQGEVAGWVLNGSSEGTQHGFLRSPGGVYTKFDLPGTTSYTGITALNNVGQFAGTMLDITGFVSQPDGSFTLLNVESLGGINDNGQIVGSLSLFDGSTHGYVGTPGPASTEPAIRTLLPGVLPASAFSNADATAGNMVAPGTWIEIYGQNLATTTRPWRDSDFQGDTAPTMLDGVTVSIGGVPAFVSYVSPGQVNALVPASVPSGRAAVTVTNGARTSMPGSITVVAQQPAILTLPPLDDPRGAYLAAVFSDFTTYALPPFPAYSNVPTRRPRAGDTIVLYGIGFGPVSPDLPIGRIATQPPFLIGSVEVTFARAASPVRGTITYAGVAPRTVGLYQFNVVLPDIPLFANETTDDFVSVNITLNGTNLAGRFLSIPFSK
jgi:uncharacterized protein (TIGR03437 family)